MLPKVDFLNIAIRQGSETSLKSDNPYIIVGEDSSLSEVTNTEVMQVDLTLMIEVPLSPRSLDVYSFLFNQKEAKNRKIAIIQSTDPAVTEQIISQPFEWIRAGGLLETKRHKGITFLSKQITEYEGDKPTSKKNDINSIEVKKYANGSKSYCFPYKFTAQVKEVEGGTKTNHLSYFVYTYVDAKEMIRDGRISKLPNTRNNLYEKMMLGDLTVQNVINNGTIKSTNKVFYINRTDRNGNEIPFPNLTDSTGAIMGKDYSSAPVWTGEVHYHGPENPGPNGYVGYMAGRGGNDMGAKLTLSYLSNNIIQDYRQLEEINKINFDYSHIDQSMFGLKGKGLFGDMHLGMDGSGNTRFGFSFNLAEAVVQNTNLPSLARHLMHTGNNNNLNEILNRKIIKDFKIYRHRIEEYNRAESSIDLNNPIKNDDAKLVVNTSEQENGRLLSKTQKDPQTSNSVGSIRQVNIDLPLLDNYLINNIRFYTGTDIGTPKSGQYAFSVEVTMDDPISTWLDDKLKSIEGILYDQVGSYSYNDYAVHSKKNKNLFNLNTGRFNQDGISNLNSMFGSGFSYNKIYQFFYILEKLVSFENEKRKADLFSFLTTISSVEFGNPTGIDIAFKTMEEIYKKILNVRSSTIKYQKNTDSLGAESVHKNSTKARSYTIKNKFKTKINANIDHLTGYDFLSIGSTTKEDPSVSEGLKTLTAVEYDNRISLETSRLFPEMPSAVIDSVDNQKNIAIHKDKTLLNPADSVGFTKYAYLSPSIINFNNSESQNILNNGSLNSDIELANNAFLNIIRYNTTNTQDFDISINKENTSSRYGDKIVRKDMNSEMKYDISYLMSNNQVSIKAKNEQDILKSNVDPTSVLLAAIQQKYFNVFNDLSLKWDYYTDPKQVYKEFYNWSEKRIQDNPYEYLNSPLKRAPNHVKALFLHLDYEKKLDNPSFESLKKQLKTKKPEAYEYEVSQERVSPLDAKDFFIADSKPIEKNKVVYQTPEFLSFFMLNFKKIVKVEYLIGYDNADINNPIWQEMTSEAWRVLTGRGGNIMCRMLPYQKELYGIKDYDFMNMPFYNRHFVINFAINNVSEANSVDRAEEEPRSMQIYINGSARQISANPGNAQTRNTLQLPLYVPRRSEDIGRSQVDYSVARSEMQQSSNNQTARTVNTNSMGRAPNPSSNSRSITY